MRAHIGHRLVAAGQAQPFQRMSVAADLQLAALDAAMEQIHIAQELGDEGVAGFS